ncbi:MAG: PD40 domain-containing protein [Anaerolineae bacterium]|nr:PD40 domain-containing protein [Anaerolineae bacterium]
MLRLTARMLAAAFLLTVMGVALPHQSTMAQDSGWRVESVVPITDYLERLQIEAPPSMRFLSPGGIQVAYSPSPEIVCAANLLSGQERCALLGENHAYNLGYNEFFPPVRWSPDSTALALVGQPYLVLRDTDLGIADFKNQVYTNITDDNFEGNIFPDAAPGTTIDIQPTWSPDGSKIAIERQTLGEEGDFSNATITIIDVKTGEARDVANLPGHETYEFDSGSVISLDWSPDGTTLAVGVLHTRPDPVYDGVWLLDIDSGEWEQIVTVDAAGEFLGNQAENPIQIVTAPVEWSPDGARLLVWISDPMTQSEDNVCIWITIDSGEITSLPLPVTTDAEHPAAWPVQAAWSPDGSKLLVAALSLEPVSDDSALLLDPNGEGARMAGIYLFDVASGQRELLGYLPFQPSRMFKASWGTDGHVLISGYSFTLTGP